MVPLAISCVALRFCIPLVLFSVLLLSMLYHVACASVTSPPADGGTSSYRPPTHALPMQAAMTQIGRECWGALPFACPTPTHAFSCYSRTTTTLPPFGGPRASPPPPASGRPCRATLDRSSCRSPSVTLPLVSPVSLSLAHTFHSVCRCRASVFVLFACLLGLSLPSLPTRTGSPCPRCLSVWRAEPLSSRHLPASRRSVQYVHLSLCLNFSAGIDTGCGSGGYL